MVLLFQGQVCENLDLYLDMSVEDEKPYQHCLCVPYWHCKEDFSGIDPEGIGILDIRSKTGDQKGSSMCTGYLDVCCKVECGIGKPVRDTSINNQDALQNRILGDNTAHFAEFPWMLGILNRNAYKCGASLIHPKVALSAAHCVISPGKYTIRAGEWDWEIPSELFPHQDRNVETKIIHPMFHTGSMENDIALLILGSPFKLTQNVGVVCLPPHNLKVDMNRCIASGWGRNSIRKGSYQHLLKKVNLPVVPKDKCTAMLRKSTLGPSFTLHESFLCAGGANKDTCKGDGGSPLICPVIGQEGRYEQIGIVSWGMQCGLFHTPGVYVNVLIFTKWIDEEMFAIGLDTDIYKL